MAETTIILTDEERNYLWELLDKNAECLRSVKGSIFNEQYYAQNYGVKLELNNSIRLQITGQLIKNGISNSNVSKDPTQATQ